jgi:ParB-like chromosome segregation protein Spo0J
MGSELAVGSLQVGAIKMSGAKPKNGNGQRRARRVDSDSRFPNQESQQSELLQEGWSWRNVDHLEEHPLNIKLYGRATADQGLLDSVKRHGVLTPVIVDQQSRILSGTRRWFSAKQVGRSNIPVMVFRGEEIPCELFLIESNRQRVKTPEQKAREFTELKRIEAALAREREKTRKSTKANLPESSCPTGKQGKQPQARDTAAKAVGMKPRTAEKIEAVIHKADAGDPKARAALDAVNAGTKSIHAAHTEVVTHEAKTANLHLKPETTAEYVRIIKASNHKILKPLMGDFSRLLPIYETLANDYRELSNLQYDDLTTKRGRDTAAK